MTSLGLLFLRVVFGGLIAVHGFPKLFGGKGRTVRPEVARVLGEGFQKQLAGGGLENLSGTMEKLEVPAPNTMAAVSAGAEFFGGLAVLLGWHTRLAALALVVNMATAVRKAHWNKGLLGPGGAEPAVLFLGAFATIFFAGPGKLAVDRG